MQTRWYHVELYLDDQWMGTSELKCQSAVEPSPLLLAQIALEQASFAGDAHDFPVSWSAQVVVLNALFQEVRRVPVPLISLHDLKEERIIA